MKASGTLREIRESSLDELEGRLQRLEEELFGHRMKRYTNQLDNTMKIRQARREIARVKTILSARKNGTETQAAATEKPAAEKE
jgi:large subunit ribosomal protein L29